MTLDEAKKAMNYGAIVQVIEQPEIWGQITALSDDESTAYISRGGYPTAITIDKLEVDRIASPGV